MRISGWGSDVCSSDLLTLAELEALHIHKTGAMIRVCLQLACAAADGLAVAQCEALDHYGKAIGLAFQIQDDVLDIEASSATLGKTAGKDEAHLKSTRSEEHTSELQSLMRNSYAVFCLKTKNTKITIHSRVKETQ